MRETARPLIKNLTELLQPLLETDADRDEWLGVALADLGKLRGAIDRSGSPRQFTRRLVTLLLTRQGKEGRRGLLNLLDDVADGKGVNWDQRLQPLREQVAAFAPSTGETASPPGELLNLRDRLLGQHVTTEFDLDAETVHSIVRYRPHNLIDYCVTRVAEWSQPRFALDKRFVQLALLMDQGKDAQGARFVAQSDREFQDLGEVLTAAPDYPALVLLGAPGSGKSTLLRRFEWDTAVNVLAKSHDETVPDAPLTFFVSLASYKPERLNTALPQPWDWLCSRWEGRYPSLPPLETLLQSGRMILLLDALNEIPHLGDEPIRLWKDFLATLNETYPGNRVIFSCRSLDYSASLSSNALPVPQVRIKSLSNERVREFLQRYCPEYADALWKNLEGTPQLDLLRIPYYLKLLIDATTEGEIPKGRAALFTSFVRKGLRREVQQDHPLFKPNELLTKRDCQRLEHASRWATSTDLPTRGILIQKLCALAYAMQEQHTENNTAKLGNSQEIPSQAGEAAQVRIDLNDALDILDHARDEDILKAGEALGVLDEDLNRDEVFYRHQLLQEYFAARTLAQQPDPKLVQVAWEAGITSPNLDETLAKIADSDRLPPLPATGWEETAVLAAAMTVDMDAYVTSLMKVNLPLAGHCAAQPDVTLGENQKAELQQALIARTEDPQADLRARIAAGLALGQLGDPRFERYRGPHGDYLQPKLVDIPDGTYSIGSDEGLYDQEGPVHTVTLTPFALGRFPVTNAEWALFMHAGGYDDERWWVTEEDKAWQSGKSTSEGSKQQWRENRQNFQQNLQQIRELQKQGRITSKQADDWERIAQMSDAEFEDQLDEGYPKGRQTAPAYWNDEAFNNPAQPVVGISWYEARAYCAWLSAQTDRLFRLPSEAEWEAAARGFDRRRFAYGDDFNSALANSFETHIRRTTPVGVFPGGKTPDTKLVDMTGNVWDWTSSLYQPYPYDPNDGRENPITGDGRRVVRGGSWGDNRGGARAAYRFRLNPGARFNDLGFRVVCSSLIL